MTVSRDSVNRVRRLVCLPRERVAGMGRVAAGTVISLENVEERPINSPYVIDAEAMLDPAKGDAVGDAVFDAMAPGASETIIDPEGISASEVIGNQA